MKKYLWIVGILAGLILVWFVLGRQEAQRQESDVPERATTVDTMTVNRIVLSRYHEPPVEFEKDAGGFWTMVQPFKDQVNTNLVEQLEKGLAVMKYVNKISEREGQHASFQIDEVSGARLQAFADSQLQADVYLGKLTPDRQHVYARPANSDVVYSATGGGVMANLRTRDIDDFRSRDILNYDPANFDSVDVDAKTASFGIARVDSASWNVRIGHAGYRPADAQVVDGLLRALGRMRASGFRPDSVAVDWGAPDVVITAWLLGEPEKKIEFKAGSGTDYWVRATGRNYDLKVFESVYKTFNRDPKELLKTSPQGS